MNYRCIECLSCLASLRLRYICDVLLDPKESTEEELKELVCRQFLRHACYPYLLASLEKGPLSRRTALFLLQELFAVAPRRLAEPLATALLSEASPRASAVVQEEKEVWEPFQAEDEEDTLFLLRIPFHVT